MAGKYFGTDGIRGASNSQPMDCQTILRVGMAAGAYFTQDGTHRHKVVIGKDTRLSGYMLEPALTAGFIAMGMDVTLVGPVPTPAISMLTKSLRADLGVMITASHNKFADNGIKFFDSKGNKLSDKIETEIEELIDSDLSTKTAKSEMLGRAQRLDDASGRYIEYVKSTFPKNLRLDGLKIVVDCANGAGYKFAPTILWELGAQVITLGNNPTGFNINENCGSTHPKIMQDAVIKNGADIGIALDGDADRVIICDEKGQILDGDQLMGAIATYFKEIGVLKGDGVVATSMSNIGLEKYLQSIDLKLERASVGDRHVIQKMRETGCNFGGEQSGHIIFKDFCSTGDGILAALQALAILVIKQQPASKMLRKFNPYPQILENIQYDSSQPDPLEADSVQKIIAQSQDKLGDDGRLVIRKSGTEPLIRVMTESSDQQLTQQITANIINAIKAV